ncbi:MAG: hypothetical protein SFU27_10695 [Thermonemataceae bacterium]|nr:hypothetical protein [Thermonemataceae bacterium]
MFIANLLYYGGYLAFFLGIYLVIRTFLRNRKNIQAIKRQEKENLARKTAFQNAPIMEKLEAIQLNDIIVHWEKSYQVIGKMKLIEMTWDENDNHIRTGRYFPIISVDDNKALVSMPKGEGVDIIWFFFQKESLNSSLTNYFLGTDENPGPAMIFADSEQMAEVIFQLPQKEEKWKMTDVGSFFFEASGLNFVKGKGETRHILAQNIENPKKYLLYFDLLEGQGSNAIFVGETLNPETEIEYVLR